MVALNTNDDADDDDALLDNTIEDSVTSDVQVWTYIYIVKIS